MSRVTTTPRDFHREFHHDLKKIAEKPDYNFVYDSLNLIRAYIPCKDIAMNTAKSAIDNLDNLGMGESRLSVSTPLMYKTKDMFVSRWLQRIPFAKRASIQMASQLVAGTPIEAVSFFSSAGSVKHDPNFAVHCFYKAGGVSDVMAMGGLIARHQIYQSPLTKSYYIAYIEMVRSYGGTFTEQERQLCAAIFDLFLAEYQRKIQPTDSIDFLPVLADVNLTSEQLALIKACFDLKRQGHKITLQTVNHCLRPQADPTKTKIHHDFNKLKARVFEPFKSDDTLHKNLCNKFKIEHVTETFKSHAYFGLYPADKEPHVSKQIWRPNRATSQYQYLSDLSHRLNKSR